MSFGCLGVPRAPLAPAACLPVVHRVHGTARPAQRAPASGSTALTSCSEAPTCRSTVATTPSMPRERRCSSSVSTRRPRPSARGSCSTAAESLRYPEKAQHRADPARRALRGPAGQRSRARRRRSTRASHDRVGTTHDAALPADDALRDRERLDRLSCGSRYGGRPDDRACSGRPRLRG